MQVANGNMGKFAHAAIDMNPKNLDVQTAVGLASATGRAPSTMKIRFHRTVCPDRHSLLIAINGEDLNAKFVTKNTRVGEKGLIALVGVEIGATHADVLDPHQRLSLPWRSWLCPVDPPQLTGLFQYDCLHVLHPSFSECSFFDYPGEIGSHLSASVLNSAQNASGIAY